MKIGIIGGGITGLTAAHHLAGDNDVVVFEKKDRLGGLAASFEHEGHALPFYYHHVIEQNHKTKEYLKKFGLLDDSKWKRAGMNIGVNGGLYEFTNPLALMGFDYLSLAGRLRYGLFGAYALTVMNPDKVKGDAKHWLESVAGKEVTKKVFEPLYAENKFGIPLNRISAKQFANRLKTAEFRTRFNYPTNGFQALINSLSKSVEDEGGVIKTNTPAKLDAGGLRVNGQEFDAVINTAPLPEFLRFTTGLPDDYAEKLGKVRYCSAVCVAFGTKSFLSEHYWTNLFKERAHMVVQHSRLRDAYPFKFNWVLRYGGSEQDFNLSDEEIRRAYLRVVRRYYSFELEWAKVFREKYASPIYSKGFPEIGYESPVQGLYQAGVVVTYPMVRDCNSALTSGEKVAKIIRGT